MIISPRRRSLMRQGTMRTRSPGRKRGRMLSPRQKISLSMNGQTPFPAKKGTVPLFPFLYPYGPEAQLEGARHCKFPAPEPVSQNVTAERPVAQSSAAELPSQQLHP